MSPISRNRLDSKPWYRQTWPWLLMAGPLAVAVAGVITIWLAVKTSDGLVEDDYYKQGLGVNQRIQRDRQAAALGLAADVMLGGDTRLLRVMVTAQPGVVMPPSLDLKITHPTRPGADQQVTLTQGGDGFYEGRLDAPISGRWRVTLEDMKDGWRLTGEWNLDAAPALRLAAAPDLPGR